MIARFLTLILFLGGVTWVLHAAEDASPRERTKPASSTAPAEPSKEPKDKPPGASPLPARDPQAEVRIPYTQQFELKSSVNQREYRIFVSQPRGEIPELGCPVMYVLDGNACFGTFVEASRRMTRAMGPVVIVGVGYPTDEGLDSGRRSYDFTPATSDEFIARLPRRGVWSTGGQDEFLDFFEKDLKPEIAKRFKVNPNRQAIFGHSLGGLLVLHALYTRPQLFQSYIAVSPSLWWNDLSILPEEREFVKRSGTRADLMIAVGGAEKEHMVDDARETAKRLAPLSAYGLRVVYREPPGEDHGTVVSTVVTSALRFAQDAGPR